MLAAETAQHDPQVESQPAGTETPKNTEWEQKTTFKQAKHDGSVFTFVTIKWPLGPLGR